MNRGKPNHLSDCTSWLVSEPAAKNMNNIAGNAAIIDADTFLSRLA